MRLLLKGLIWAIAIAVIGSTLWQGAANQLGPDPGKVLSDTFGLWALRFLLATLLLRPLFEITGKPVFIQLRRLLGLLCWLFASLHFAAGLVYVIGFSYPELLKAFSEKTYIVLGLLAWLLMFPLGITSSRFAQRKLGRRWGRLHRLIYPLAIFACLHFVWLVRSDYWEPALYGLFLTLLLGWRIPKLRSCYGGRAARHTNSPTFE